MGPMSLEMQELWNKADEDLISMLGAADPPHPMAATVHRILDHRRALGQAAAAKALLEATGKQAAAGDSLVKSTSALVGATGRLACATWTLAATTVFLVVVAALQAYATFR